jgi:hypothetical protein
MFVRLFCLDEIPSRRGRKIEMAVVVDLVENFGFECNPKRSCASVPPLHDKSESTAPL